jgi:hypothetical protein
MDARDVAEAALRVLSLWTHGIEPNSQDVKILRSHALVPDEMDLSIDELACRVIRRECARVIEESQVSRKNIDRNCRHRKTA